MAEKLTIRYWDDPVLSTVCNAVEDNEFGPKLEEFGESLLATMDAHNGIGLAGPQVGVAKRVFVMHQGQSAIIAVNPVVSPYGSSVGHEEGCLSVPGVRVWIERAKQAILKYQEPATRKWNEIALTDIEAFCAAHEEDHLNGIMLFDRRRVSRQGHRQALREWEKFKHNYR